MWAVVKRCVTKKRGCFTIEFDEVTVAAMNWTIFSYIMRHAIDSDSAGIRRRNLTASRKRRLKWLEPDASEGARPVLRGGSAGNSISLPDRAE